MQLFTFAVSRNGYMDFSCCILAETEKIFMSVLYLVKYFWCYVKL